MGSELTKKSIMALIVVMLAIILFIAYAFRRVSKPVSSCRYGLIAVFTLIHDILLTTLVFIIISNNVRECVLVQFQRATMRKIFAI
ncbi:MAG: hypothetical protein IH984_16695 [Planctomycetes bacterium]|nr:hypothetical protein [Planctomycetota bacterium]